MGIVSRETTTETLQGICKCHMITMHHAESELSLGSPIIAYDLSLYHIQGTVQTDILNAGLIAARCG